VSRPWSLHAAERRANVRVEQAFMALVWLWVCGRRGRLWAADKRAQLGGRSK
jgi:hypothetical protein